MIHQIQFRLKTARSGDPIAEINGINLHSPYDPVKEARRFAGSSFNGKTPGTIILLGPGLGYLTTELKRKFPKTRLLPVYFTPEIYKLSGQQGQQEDQGWHPGMAIPLLDYLRRNLCELDLHGLVILEWPASIRIFAEFARQVNTIISQLLKELSGSFITSYTLGRLWLRNSLLNFIHLDHVGRLQPADPSKPVIIAGSGPSLAAAAPKIRSVRKGISLWALPSAVSFLQDRELLPDLVVLTDPGYYSTCHLQPLQRAAACIVMPLSAAAGTWHCRAPVTFLLQPTFFEQQLIGSLPEPFPLIPPHGTVAATAVELALLYTRGPVITAGLDFCCQDLHSHVLPNAFDSLLSATACRTDPLYNRYYWRTRSLMPERDNATGTRTSRPLLTYAGWFNNLPMQKRQRLFKLPGLLPGRLNLREITPAALGRFASAPHDFTGSYPVQPIPGYPGRPERKKTAKRLLASWLRIVKEEQVCLQTGRYDPDSFFDKKGLTGIGYYTDLDRLHKAYSLTKIGEQAAALTILRELLDTAADFMSHLAIKAGSRE